MVVPRRHPRIVVLNEADLPQGSQGSSARAYTNFSRIRVENGGNQKANFVCNNNARIEKDIVRIVQIIIVGLDSLSPSSAPVELGEIREGIILAISVNTKRRNKSVRLRITSAEFCTESANCSARSPLLVRADIRRRPCGYMRITRAVVCGKS